MTIIDQTKTARACREHNDRQDADQEVRASYEAVGPIESER